MMKVCLSSSTCRVPAAPERILSDWLQLRGGRALGLAIDARLPPNVQRELLGLATQGSVRCAELTYPLCQSSGRPLPSPLGADRAERHAARAHLLDFLQLAERHQVERVVLRPWQLELFRPLDELTRLFALDLPLPIDELSTQRSTMAPVALDRLKSTIDPLLGRAAATPVVLLIAGPVIWPHQLPNADEAACLQREFSGAPLGITTLTDWCHASQQTGLTSTNTAGEPFDQVPGTPTAPPILSPEALIEQAGGTTSVGPPSNTDRPHAAHPVDAPTQGDASTSDAERGKAPPAPTQYFRLADAAGLTLGLPIGCGEIDWPEMLEPVADPDQIVLAFDPETSEAELEHSIDLLQSITGMAAEGAQVLS